MTTIDSTYTESLHKEEKICGNTKIAQEVKKEGKVKDVCCQEEKAAAQETYPSLAKIQTLSCMRGHESILPICEGGRTTRKFEGQASDVAGGCKTG